MATRTRTRGSDASVPIAGTLKRFRESDRALISTTALATYEKTGHPYESITDVVGTPGNIHNVTHTKLNSSCQGGKAIHIGPVVYTGTLHGYCHYEFDMVVPLRSMLSTQNAHLGALSGIKALAIARVPAYTHASMEAFVSLMEAKELADTMAVKSAAALARYMYMVVNAKRGGFLKQFVTRDGKRAIQALRRAKPADAKALFQTALAGINVASNANMEWKYGISPMISDVQKANAAAIRLGQLRQKLLDGVRVYGKATEVRNTSGVSLLDVAGSSGFNGEIGKFELNWSKTTKTTAVASIVRKLNPTDPTYDVDWFTQLDIVSEVNGLSPSAKRLWQLMPLTFITDWFWNVADLLESLETLASPIGSAFTSTGGLYSTKVETTVTGGGKFAYAKNPTTYEGKATRTSYDRNTDPLTGGPVLYIPPLRLPTKAGQWFSMAQIGFQRLVGRH